MTTTGWGRKLSYCIAFSIDGATDVTRRYVRYPAKHGAPRNRVSEEVLLWTIYEIRRRRREKLSPEERRRLAKEDEREERELRSLTATALASEIMQLSPFSPRPQRSDDQKSPASREEGATEFLNSRQTGDTGNRRFE